MATNDPILNQEDEEEETGKISDYIPFEDVVLTLDRVSQETKIDKKKKHLQKLINCYRKFIKDKFGTLDSKKCNGESLYPLFRILLPKFDRGREAYCFQSYTLARIFLKILSIDERTPDAIRLKNFRDPKKAGPVAGDISEIVYRILKDRFASTENKRAEKPTLYYIHAILDKLAIGRGANTGDNNQAMQKAVLQHLLRKLTSIEMKWLIRILLKDLRIGVNQKAIFGLLHKQARLFSEKMSNLELLCQKLNDPEVEISEMDITLMIHFSPMLSTRMDIIESSLEEENSSQEENTATASILLKKKPANPVTLPQPPFWVETKWDGERFQIHFDGSEFKYFSRRAYDFSDNFNQTMTPRLKEQLNAHVQSFIVDGEMMAYHKKYKIFTQKGFNIDVKTMNKDNPNHCPVFVAFDLVFLNGKVLTTLPLRERREKLLTVFQEKEDIVRVSEVKVKNTRQEVVALLDSAIDDGEEGLIVKDRDSAYVPGQRGMSWLKIKPEYLEDNSVDDLDLLILGLYYPDSNKRNLDINHFLVGIVDNSPGKPQEYYPIGTVGTGRLRSVAMKELVQKLRPKCVKPPSTSFSIWQNIHFKQRKKPDFLIPPKDSVVVQVKASEIIPTDIYTLGYTLRFPRIIQTREDKSPNDIMTVEEFHRLREACNGKLAKRTDEGHGGGGGPRKMHPFQRRKRFSYNERLNDIKEEDDSDYEEPIPYKKSCLEESGLFEDDDEPKPGPSRVRRKPIAIMPKKGLQKFTAFSSHKSSTTTSASTTPGTSPVKNPKHIFASKVFHLIGMTTWKQDLEKKILEFGGSITHNPDVPDLFTIIGQKRHSPAVEKAIKSEKFNVMSKVWLLRCVEKKEEIPPGFGDFWYMTKETKENLKNECESYSESYSQETEVDEKEEEEEEIVSKTPEPSDDPKSPSLCGSSTSSSATTPGKKVSSVKKVPNTINTPPKRKIGPMTFDVDSSSSSSDTDFEMDGRNGDTQDPDLPKGISKVISTNNQEKKDSGSDTDFSDFEMPKGSTNSRMENAEEDEGLPEMDSNPFMDEVELVFRGNMSPDIVSQFKRAGGTVKQNEDEWGITHIVCCRDGNPSLEDHPRALLVKQKWLEDCLERKEVLDEWRYRPSKY